MEMACPANWLIMRRSSMPLRWSACAWVSSNAYRRDTPAPSNCAPQIRATYRIRMASPRVYISNDALDGGGFARIGGGRRSPIPVDRRTPQTRNKPRTVTFMRAAGGRLANRRTKVSLVAAASAAGRRPPSAPPTLPHAIVVSERRRIVAPAALWQTAREIGA